MPLNVHEFEEIPRPDPGADQRWWKVNVDDGTIPATIKVWMTENAWLRLDHLNDDVADEYEWMRRELARLVRDMPRLDQVAWLRTSSPLELVVPDET